MITARHTASRNAIIRRTLLLFTPTASIALIVIFFIFYTESDADLTKTRAAEAATIRLGAHTVEHMMDGIIRDATYLAEHDTLIELTSGGGPQIYQRLVWDWLVFSRSKGSYDQIRWIDLDGRERVRVNFNNGVPRPVPEANLQDKHGRYYFRDTISLSRGQIYVSPLDLNIENKKIERPLKPMIRIGTPVFDRMGNKRGVIILNYLGNILIHELDRVMDAAAPRTSLINREGYWLKGPAADLEWGFMFKRPDVSMAQRHPDAWRRIADAEAGQFADTEGLWTFETIYPLMIGETAEDGKSDLFASPKTSRQYAWKTVLWLPRAEYLASVWRTGGTLAMAAALLLGGLLFGSWRLAKAWARKHEAEENLHHLNAALESTIAERTTSLRAEVAERKKTEAVLRQSNEDLRQFAHIASHDLREPLRTITSYLQLLNRKYENALDDEAHQFLNFAVTGAKRMDVLIKDLLRYSTVPQQGKAFALVDTKGILSEVLVDFRDDLSACEGTIRVGDLPQVAADRSELERLFRNLIDNAVKYRAPERRLAIEIDAKRDDGSCTFRVQDNGIGIAPQYYDRIFVMFQRLHRQDEYNGTGIGLALCKKIVERHGGRIWVESEPDVGSTFFVRLPSKALPSASPQTNGATWYQPVD